MQDIPEAEARELLGAPMRCEDAPAWAPLKMQSETSWLQVGVVDSNGKNVQLHVDFQFRRSQTTKSVKYKFSVYRRLPYGLERVYQLQVNKFERPVKNRHESSHEHIGNLRVLGDASWCDWGYDDVIAYFCRQTNITFDPAPAHPEDFALRGD